MQKESCNAGDAGGMILRDYLAVDRTILANERTLLSYIRTAMAFAGAGTALIHFFDSGVAEGVGWVLIPTGIMVFLAGIRRYISVRNKLKRLTSDADGGIYTIY